MLLSERVDMILKGGVPVSTVSGDYKKVADNPSMWEWIKKDYPRTLEKDTALFANLLKTGKSFFISNKIGEPVEFLYSKGGVGIRHILERRFEEITKTKDNPITDRNRAGKFVSFTLANMTDTVRNGSIEKQPRPNTEIIRKNGFSVIVKQDNGKFVVTGFIDRTKKEETTEFIDAGIAHYEHFKKKSGEVTGALKHKDIGDIDLVWGVEGTSRSDGYGLAKLAKYHPEVLNDLQGIISDMEVVKKNENRAQLESKSHKASVRLTWNGNSKKWLLTAFEKNSGASDSRTGIARTDGSRKNDTATLANTAGSSIPQALKKSIFNTKPVVRESFAGSIRSV